MGLGSSGENHSKDKQQDLFPERYDRPTPRQSVLHPTDRRGHGGAERNDLPKVTRSTGAI